MSRIANWVKQSTATTGTGTITLGAADTGFVGIEDWLSDGQQVHYFIEDSDSGDREEGNGIYASGAGTVTRAEIIATVTAGTLAKFPGSGLTLVGPSTITLSASADNIFNGGTQFLATSNDWDIPDNFSDYADSVGSSTADRMYLYPAVLNFRRRINEVHISVSVGAAVTASAYVGIWDQQIDGNPGNLLFDSGAIDVEFSGTKDITVSPELVLNPGVYWFGYVSDNAAVRCKGFQTSLGSVVGGFGGAGKFNQLRRLIPYVDSPTIPLVSNLTVTNVTDIDDAAGIAFT